MKNLYLVLFITLGLNYSFAQQSIDRSFNGITRIDLSTASGDCNIVKGGKDVRVELEHTYDSDVFTPVLEQKGDRLTLKEEFKRNNRSNGYSKWKLTVPDDIKLSFNTGSGNLNAQDIDINITSNSGSGNVIGKKLKGSLTSNSGSGNTELDQFDGELSVNAGSGNVELADSKGEFSVNLGSGNVEGEGNSGEFSVNVGSGDIEMEDAIITGASSFNSGSGDATVIISAPLQDNISINSGSGDATLDFNGQTVEGVFTMKANKQNGDISAPFEFDSEVEEENGRQTTVKKMAKVGNSSVEIKIGTGSGKAAVKK